MTGEDIKKLIDSGENELKNYPGNSYEFKEISGGMQITFYKNDATVNATVNATQKKIIEEILRNNSVTYDDLSAKLEKERTTIYRNIKELVDLGIIIRIGSDKNGYWEVTPKWKDHK